MQRIKPQILLKILLILSISSCAANKYYTIKPRPYLIADKINVYVYSKNKAKAEKEIGKNNL